METTISFVCPRCGTVGKSGKNSCCGRGGSWFRNCGSEGNTRLHHTWYEGIQVCKAQTQQSKTVIAQQKSIHSSHGAGKANYKAVIATATTFKFTSSNTSVPVSGTTPIITSTYGTDMTTPAHTLIMNTPTDVSMISSVHASVGTSIITQGCDIFLEIIIHINILFIIVF